MLYRANSGSRLASWSSRRKRAAQVSSLSTSLSACVPE
jgi:hypothetical protein